MKTEKTENPEAVATREAAARLGLSVRGFYDRIQRSNLQKDKASAEK